MKLIAIVGPKGSGKDASFELLRDDKLVNGKISFADPLKELCAKHFGLPIQYMHDPDLKEKKLPQEVICRPAILNRLKGDLHKYLDPYKHDYNAHTAPIQGVEGRIFTTPREILQIIGTEFIRNAVKQNWHLEAAFQEEFLSRKLRRTPEFINEATFVVTDCRFLNEYEFLKTKGELQAFYIERPEAEKRLAEATHQSELEVLKIKEAVLKDGGTVIKNDGSLEDLKNKLTSLLVSKEGKDDGTTSKSKSKRRGSRKASS